MLSNTMKSNSSSTKKERIASLQIATETDDTNEQGISTINSKANQLKTYNELSSVSQGRSNQNKPYDRSQNLRVSKTSTNMSRDSMKQSNSFNIVNKHNYINDSLNIMRLETENSFEITPRQAKADDSLLSFTRLKPLILPKSTQNRRLSPQRFATEQSRIPNTTKAQIVKPQYRETHKSYFVFEFGSNHFGSSKTKEPVNSEELHNVSLPVSNEYANRHSTVEHYSPSRRTQVSAKNRFSLQEGHGLITKYRLSSNHKNNQPSMSASFLSDMSKEQLSSSGNNSLIWPS